MAASLAWLRGIRRWRRWRRSRGSCTIGTIRGQDETSAGLDVDFAAGVDSDGSGFKAAAREVVMGKFPEAFGGEPLSPSSSSSSSPPPGSSWHQGSGPVFAPARVAVEVGKVTAASVDELERMLEEEELLSMAHLAPASPPLYR